MPVAQFHATSVVRHAAVQGWAATAPADREADMAVHDRLKDFNESPLYLVLDYAVGAAELTDAKELPITLFETVTQIVNSVPCGVFVKVGYKIEQVEPERISVDHVARSVPAHAWPRGAG